MVKTRGARAKVAEKKRSARKGEAKSSRKTLAKSNKAVQWPAKAAAPTKSMAKPTVSSATQGHAWPGLPPGYFDRAR